MATGKVVNPKDPIDPAASRAVWEKADRPPLDFGREANAVLKALASLRLTVWLFALAIFLVFVGTLAQVDHDIWHVVNHTYFRVWIAQVELRAFGRLIGMFSDYNPEAVTAWFPFPGGRLLGVGLFVNLVAAHLVRFKTSAKGRRLSLGLGVIAAGVAATIAVIVSGMDNAIESELSPAFCNNLWQALRAAWAGTALLGVYWIGTKWGKIGRVEWSIAALLVAALAGSAAYLLINDEWRINDSGLRILWQLLKCTAAAAVLLIGCVMTFKKRAGIVLLHAGVGLLLVSEAVTDYSANESRMVIDEGQTTSFTSDLRTSELAFIDRSGEESDRVAVVPQAVLASAASSGGKISHAGLPFDLRVQEFHGNAALLGATTGRTNPATKGLGERVIAEPIKSVNGITNNGINFPAAYIELLDKQTGDSAGVYLVTTGIDTAAVPQLKWISVGPGLTWLNQQLATRGVGQQAETGGKAYEIALRFKREYKPYAVTLNKFTKRDYVGTNTPKDYSSYVTLADVSRQIERDFRVYMNNPLRFGGDTLYQADFDKQTQKTTILQVVTNRGWMLPYVSLMMVGIGMLAQFLTSLGRFAGRRMQSEANRDAAAKAVASMVTGIPLYRMPEKWFPLAVALLCLAYLGGKARLPADSQTEMHVQAFGALPIAEGGRIKPYDTLARTTLQFLSNRQEVDPYEGKERTPAEKLSENKGKLPAIVWLLDTVTGKKDAGDYRVFRIENLDLLDTLGLEPRKGSFRYSYNEINREAGEFNKQKRLIRGVPKEDRTVFQKKVGELATRVSTYELLIGVFASPRFDGDPSMMQQNLQRNLFQAQELQRFQAARVTPPLEAGGEWLSQFEAELNDLLARVRGKDRNPATAALGEALAAYAGNDRRGFNTQVRRLQQIAADLQAEQDNPANAEQIAGMAPAERINLAAVRFETFFSAFSPFYYCAVCYLLAFVLAAASWLGWTRPLSRAATAVIAVTLLVHTFALVGRIYISGRPPVTNLYSSAVFIGWAAVLFGLAAEMLYRIGIGNVVASVIGFATLVIAHQLSLDGDTFTVMQAVLDTQFWLATHVVTITLGYATTFLAGFFGVVYLIGRHTFRRLSKESGEQVTRMMYGVLCFSLLFSFIGTVLGGLWADDSWGRFWGWDPKENGALIIVLWNALILHARWGAMVKARGLATLAVLGNIVTAWSWFGVNELGVGLHAYGASERSTAYWLLGFAVSQMLIAALALIPAGSTRVRPQPPTAARA